MSLTELFPATEDGDVVVELIIPQLTYANDANVGTRTHYGIKSISIGNLFRQTFGREVKSNETVVCKFQPIDYRGAFKSRFTNPSAGGGEASFLLGDGWNGNYPKAMVLNIPAGCRIYGGPSRPYEILNADGAVNTTAINYDQSRAPALFSLRGTEAFINTTTPLKLVGSGALYQSGGIGAGRHYNYRVGGIVVGGDYGSGWQHGYARGGFGMSYPFLSGGTYTPPSNEAVPNLSAPVFIVTDVIPTAGRSASFSVIVDNMRDSSTGMTWTKQFFGGTGGRWGQAGTDGYYVERTSPYPAGLSGTHPGLLFELGDPYNNRFTSVAIIEASIDYSEFTGNVNGFTKTEWNTSFVGSLRQTMNWYGNAIAYKSTKISGVNAVVRHWSAPLGDPRYHQPIRN